MSNQAKTNNLNYLVDPKFNKVNRLFALSFENEDDRTSYSKHYTSKVKIKYFNVYYSMAKVFFNVSIKKQRRNIRKNYWNEQK